MTRVATNPPLTEVACAAPAVSQERPADRQLRRLAVNSSAWTFLGQGGTACMRLISNLILARLVVPEAFGLTAIVGVVMIGLQMLSDFGLGPAIIRDRRDDESFLNTAWTIQVIRGFVLWLFACALALPVAWFYHQPMFVKLVPVVALTAIMSGFFSTGMHTAKREMQLARLTILELLVQAVAMAIMIAWALISPTVWALVVGGVCGSVVKLVLSHIMLGVPLNRFGWDKEAAASLLDFGKWIFVNSGLFFLSTNCDRLLVGRLLNMAQFGVFSVAYALSQPAILVNHHLARSVFMPMLARTDRERPDRLVDVYYRYRFYLDLLLLPALGALVALAPWAVYVLYDYRYAAAGAMLQLFAVHAITRCLAEPCESCALALGYPKYITVAYIVRTIWIVTVIPLGWWFGGVEGVVWAACLKEIVVLGILWWFLGKLKILRWSRELLALAMALAGFTCGTFLLPLLPI